MERREDRVIYELHRAVAQKILDAPEEVRATARHNLGRMRLRPRNPYAESWLDEWSALIDGPVESLIETMLRADERANDLRQMTPFAGVLTDDERQQAINKASFHATT